MLLNIKVGVMKRKYEINTDCNNTLKPFLWFLVILKQFLGIVLTLPNLASFSFRNLHKKVGTVVLVLVLFSNSSFIQAATYYSRVQAIGL